MSSQTQTDIVEEKPHPRSKRDQIVRAAIKVFLENGFKATSMNRVAEEAGVIKATIYSHFKDKEQLFIAIVEELTLKKVDLNYEDLTPVLALTPDQFVDMVSDKFAALLNDPEYHRLFRVMVGESERFPELATIYVKTVISKGMDLAIKYFDAHPELNIEDSAAMAHICAGSYVSLMAWQKVLGGEKVMPLEFSRVKRMLKVLICERIKPEQ
jgi:AcrR family transcriptional regulator